MNNPTITDVFVGFPETFGKEGAVDPDDRPWTSAIFKHRVDGPVRLGLTNLEGDGQADRRVHGGVDKAVLVYAAAHYPFWRERPGLPTFPHGAFGENLTVDGMDEESVCIGDVFEAGTARVQVSQPRMPCWKLQRRWRVHDLVEQVQSAGPTGWYLRVLQEGHVCAGRSLRLLERARPDWTIARLRRLRAGLEIDLCTVAELADDPHLAMSWRSEFARMLSSQTAIRAPAAGNRAFPVANSPPGNDRSPLRGLPVPHACENGADDNV